MGFEIDTRVNGNFLLRERLTIRVSSREIFTELKSSMSTRPLRVIPEEIREVDVWVSRWSLCQRVNKNVGSGRAREIHCYEYDSRTEYED